MLLIDRTGEAFTYRQCNLCVIDPLDGKLAHRILK